MSAFPTTPSLNWISPSPPLTAPLLPLPHWKRFGWPLFLSAVEPILSSFTLPFPLSPSSLSLSSRLLLQSSDPHPSSSSLPPLPLPRLKPWFTPEIRLLHSALSRSRNRLRRCPYSSQRLRVFVDAKTSFCSAVAVAKRSSFQAFASSIQPGSMWSALKRLSSNPPPRPSGLPPLPFPSPSSLIILASKTSSFRSSLHYSIKPSLPAPSQNAGNTVSPSLSPSLRVVFTPHTAPIPIQSLRTYHPPSPSIPS